MDQMRIDMLEVGGRGGVFQHSVALAAALANQTPEFGPVVLHTANDHEDISAEGAVIWRSFNWFRNVKIARSVFIGVAFLFVTLPQVRRSSDSVVWVQGLFKTPLTAIAIAYLRVCGKYVVFSPHNLFSRGRGQGQDRWLRYALSWATLIVVYNKRDEANLQSLGRRAVRLPLIMPYPYIDPDVKVRWSWVKEEGFTVASLGQIREDKNLPFLVEACAGVGAKLIIMGPDAGAVSGVYEAVSRFPGVAEVRVGYFELAELAAVAESVRVVALPYSVASQSAVAVLAHDAGATVLALDIGGLSEQADILVSSMDLTQWTDGLQRALAEPRATDGPVAASAHDWSNALFKEMST